MNSFDLGTNRLILVECSCEVRILKFVPLKKK